MRRGIFLFFLFVTSIATAQTALQTLRGIVVDKELQKPLELVSVVVTDLQPVKGTLTDEKGKFRINNISVGRHTVRISRMDYEPYTTQIVLESGKETVLHIELEPRALLDSVVVIESHVDKTKPLNEMAIVSARTFSVEETQRYAAALNDPARMAASFAGVVQAGDGNSIVIRGNSPAGLLWRLEGVDIPNPNHFSSVGSSGGGIAILSAQLLTNSDFMTGAFPAEYGNGLSGVFDLRLRTGNNEHREFTAQAGFIGFDLAAEGPFKKNGGSSYLVNYRYSTVGLLTQLGVNVIDGVTRFQDLSFNTVFPLKKGVLTVFGFGGLSAQDDDAKSDSSQWKRRGDRLRTKFFSNTAATGITYRVPFGDKNLFRSALAASFTGNGFKSDYLQNDYSYRGDYDEHYNQTRFTYTASLTTRINNRHTLRSGIIAGEQQFDLQQRSYDPNSAEWMDAINENGQTQTAQAYTQWKFRPAESFTMLAGVHALYLALNNTWSVEPRAALRKTFAERHAVSIGYGLHSQALPLIVYFLDLQNASGQFTQANRNLLLPRAHHFVLSYDFSVNEFFRVKVELYDQLLFDVPVSADSTKNFSTINLLDGDVSDSLVNKGFGQNKGVELTIERFLHHGWYALLTASVYDSKYKALDGVWRNTRFNGRFAGNALFGKEIVTGEKWKHRVFGFNLKLVYSGGYRDTPIDVNASLAQQRTVRTDSLAWTEQMPDYFRIDLRVSLQRNYAKWSSTLAFDVQNVTNRKNIFSRYFDLSDGEIHDNLQLPLIPVLSWKVQF